MALKMTLEPQEWVMVGGTKVVNICNEKAKFKIEGSAPVLRQAHTLTELQADTAAKRVYHSLQLLYLGLAPNPDKYFRLVEVLLKLDPKAREVVQKANKQIATRSFYGALKEYRKLIALESV